MMKSRLIAYLTTLAFAGSCALFAQAESPAPVPNAPAAPQSKEAAALSPAPAAANAAEQAAQEDAEAGLILGKLLPEQVADMGFTPIASWIGEFWQSSRAGEANGVMWDSLLTFGFEQDLGKPFGKEGWGTLGLSAFYYATADGKHGLGDGLNGDPSNIFASDMVRVFEIYYANAFEASDWAFDVRVGQLAADEDFMGLDYADVFLNSNFGAIPAVAGAGLYNGNTAFSQYALATLGVVARATRDNFDFALGVYNGDAGDDTPGNHGFDYELSGVALWYQMGMGYELSGRKGYAAFGGNYHSGAFEDVGSGDKADGFYSFYLLLSQELVLDDEQNPVLGAFCRLAWAPQSSRVERSRYLDAGVNWFGPIPSRPDDVFAVGVSTAYADEAVRAATGLFSYETCIEATYKAQLAPAVSLQPTLQIYFDSHNPSTSERETAFLFGVRVEVAL